MLLAACDSSTPSDSPPPEAAIITGEYVREFENYTVLLRFTPDAGATQQGMSYVFFDFRNGDVVEVYGRYVTRTESNTNLLRLLDESCTNEGHYYYDVDARSLSFRLAMDTCIRARDLPGDWERQP